jgi:hypothetical protein
MTTTIRVINKLLRNLMIKTIYSFFNISIGFILDAFIEFVITVSTTIKEAKINEIRKNHQLMLTL